MYQTKTMEKGEDNIQIDKQLSKKALIHTLLPWQLEAYLQNLQNTNVLQLSTVDSMRNRVMLHHKYWQSWCLETDFA